MSREKRQSLLHEGTGAPTISAYVELTLDNAEGRMPGKSSVTIRRMIGLEKDEYSIDKKTATKGSFLVCWKQSALARAISPENLEDVKEKSDLLIKICEAIVLGKQEGAEFDEEEDDMIEDDDDRTIELSLQLAALACLIDLYAGRNSDGSSKNQDVLRLDVSNDIPKRVSCDIDSVCGYRRVFRDRFQTRSWARANAAAPFQNSRCFHGSLYSNEYWTVAP